MILKIIGLMNGMETPFDSQYVVEYDPTWHLPSGAYDGGKLVTTHDITQARHFASAQEAMDYWRQSYGLRDDGKPNRPLTAYSVEVEPSSITCKECGLTSHNLNDVKNRYCGNCHKAIESL